MGLLLTLLSLAVLNLTYYTGKFTWAIIWGVHNDHYFLGYNPHLFTIRVFGISFSIGIYIPIIGLSRIYKIEDGERKRIDLAWEFFNHPIWKRFVVELGGTILLIILSIICFISITYIEPEQFISKDTINKYGIDPSERAIKEGFEIGDKILKVNGQEYQRLTDLLENEDEVRYTIDRNDRLIEITVDKTTFENKGSSYAPFFKVLIPPIIREVQSGSPAEHAGLLTGDRFTRINEIPVTSFDEFINELNKVASGEVDISIQRILNHDTISFEKTVILNEAGLIGFLVQYPQRSNYQNTLLESIIKGTQKSFGIIATQVSGFQKLFANDIVPSKSLSGPIGIAKAYGGTYQWIRFWRITGLLAMVAAFLNLLPLPRASFWQVVPLLFEAITKKKFSYKAYIALRKIGIGILIATLIWILVGDIIMLF